MQQGISDIVGHTDSPPKSFEGANAVCFFTLVAMVLLLLFFYGVLPCGKYGGVCHVDAEKEQQCLAAGVACRYTADAIVLFLIAEAALHGGRAQCPDYSPGCAYVSLFILGLRTFADKTGCYAVFGTVPPVIIVGIDGVSADPGDIDACQFLLIFNALL